MLIILYSSTVKRSFFYRFKIRDIETSTTLFEIAKPVAQQEEEEADAEAPARVPEAASEAGAEETEDEKEEEEDGEGEEAGGGDEVDSNAGRFVRYQFTSQVGHF
jgi:hypothetical protein